MPAVASELDRIADDLYSAHPDGFAAARDEAAKAARAAGNKELAKELAALKKPTMSAWLVNTLWRGDRKAVEQLFDVADELAKAHSKASGQALRELTAKRREVESALIKRAAALAENAGVKTTAAMEREAQDTLAAAMARPEVADEIRTGRLVKPTSYAGFTGFGEIIPDAAAAAPAKSPKAEPEPRRAEPKADKRREEAQDVVDAAAAALAQATKAADAADTRYEELRAQVEELREKLRESERELATARTAASGAKMLREQADKAHAAATKALERLK